MKIFKKSLSVLLAVLMALTCLGAVAFAAEDTITVSLRVEGITSNLYYGDVKVKADATALDVVKEADKLDDSLTVSVVNGFYGPYITAVNGEKEATFKGWDGWLFRVNDIEPEVGVSAYTVSNGDSLVLYYGDPYGVGMQYPHAMISELDDGTLSFASLDTVYDEFWNPTTKEVTVKDCKLIWGLGNGKTTEITPDENGIFHIDAKYRTKGTHSIQIERYAENGCPTVLRLAPDDCVKINRDAESIFAKIIRLFREFFERIFSIFG